MRGTVQARRTKNRSPVRRADDLRPYEKTGAQHSGRIISAPTKSGYPVWGTVHIRPRKTEIRYRGRNVSTRCAVFRLPRRGRSQTGPTNPASPFLRPRRGGPPDPASLSLRPRRGGPCGRPPRRTRHPLPFGPSRQPAVPWDVPRPGPRPQRFRVGGGREQPRNRGRTLCAPTKGRESGAAGG